MSYLKIVFCLFLILINYCSLFPIQNEQKEEENLLIQYLWREIITLPKEKRPKVGLVLGGGGARGLSHIGVLRVLEEEGFPIDIVTGTSVGALVGALYCSGISVDKIELMASDIGWSSLTNVSFTSLAGLLLAEKLLSTEKMEQYIIQQIGHKQFHELKKPFACVATDLKTGEKIIFTEGDVALAVRASATIPGVFSPVEYRHRLLIDGGLVDNIPTDLAKLLGADIVIAVNIAADFTKYSTSNILLVLNQSIYIQGDILSYKQLSLADIVINPKVSDISAYELGRAKECIDAGIIETRRMIPKLKRLLIDRTFRYLLESK